MADCRRVSNGAEFPNVAAVSLNLPEGDGENPAVVETSVVVGGEVFGFPKAYGAVEIAVGPLQVEATVAESRAFGP